MDMLTEYVWQNKLALAKKLSVKCNSFTECFGLSLTENQMVEITEKRFEALKRTGRVEFGEGITEKLILVFRSSPFIWQGNFEDTIIELQELFYYFKGECDEVLSDDELLLAMERIFNGEAGGSTEYLSGIQKEKLCLAAKEKPLIYEGENDEERD